MSLVRAVDRQISYFFIFLSILAFGVPLYLAYTNPNPASLGLWDPLIWTTMVYLLSILLLVYERSLSIAREKVVYLAEELSPLIRKVTEWSLTRKSSEEKLPVLINIREIVIPQYRFLLLLNLIPRSYVRLLEEVYVGMRDIQRELTWLHSAVRADPKGHKVLKEREDVSVDEVIYEVVTGRTDIAETEVMQAIAPILEQHTERLAKVQKLFNQLLEQIPRLQTEWQAYIRANYVSSRIPNT